VVFSEKHNYIFIEVAKTASTSIKKFLLENDPTAIENHFIDNSGKLVRVNTHINARKLKLMMGDRYDKFIKIGFVRDPYSTIVSNYHFYKNGRAFKNVDKKRLSIKIKVTLANLIPFWFWALLYPYKLNRYFVSDGKDIIVDYLGRFSRLEEDFFKIFDDIGVHFSKRSLPLFNPSFHKPEASYYGRILKRLVCLRIKSDLHLLKFVEKLVNCRVSSNSCSNDISK
jgi:hypothetical protein